MRKNILRLLLLTALLTGSLSCVREDMVENTSRHISGDKITIKASHELDTKTGVVDGGTSVLWDAEEEIKVFCNEEDASFTSSNQEPASTVEFTGQITYTRGDKLVALYPYREDATYKDGKIYTTLYHLQTGREGSFAKNTNLSVAESESLGMTFKNVAGGVRFSLERDDIVEVAIESIGEEPLAGKITIKFEEGIPVVESVADPCTRVSVDAPEEAFEPGKWYYISLLPGTLKEGARIMFTRTDGYYGTLTMPNEVEFRRSMFASKEKIDAGVTEWEAPEEQQVELSDGEVVVQIPAGTDPDFMSGLVLTNAYGQFPLEEPREETKAALRKRKNAYGDSYKVSYFQFGTSGTMLQFLRNLNGEPMMSCLWDPYKEAIIDAKSTALTILLTTPQLISDDPDEIEATKVALDNLKEFGDFVTKVETQIRLAFDKCTAPDFSQLNPGPVILALLNKYHRNPDVPQSGTELLGVSKNGSQISFKVANNYKRVVHVYGRKVWMGDGNGVVPVRDQDVTYTMEDIFNKLTGTSLEELKAQLGADFTDEDIEEAKKMFRDLTKDKVNLSIPFPYMVVPESASYWKIVKGTWWDKDDSSIFRTETDDLSFDIGDADGLFVDVYGMGSLEKSFSEYDSREQLKIAASFLHGGYNDFIDPLINLVYGLKKPKWEPYHYDLRYGARKYPERALVLKLAKNFDAAGYIMRASKSISEGDYWQPILEPIGYVADQILGNADNEDKRTYWNLIYNICKKHGVLPSRTSDEFRKDIKEVWNGLDYLHNWKNVGGVAGTTIKLSEVALDLGGAAYALWKSDAIVMYPIYRDDSPEIKIISPKKDEVVHTKKINFNWEFSRGGRTGNVVYDLKVTVANNGGSVTKTYKDLKETYYTVNISDFKDEASSGVAGYQIIAHQPGYPSNIMAQTEVIPFTIAALQGVSNAVDLGLSVRWAPANLGASDVEDKGDFYAWGEIEPKNEFSWENYQFGHGANNNQMSMYNETDALKILRPGQDAAHVKLQGNWRMPTIDEWNELRDKCTWKEVKYGDKVIGYDIVSKVNGKAIYIPMTGYIDGKQEKEVNSLRYWYSNITDGPYLWTARCTNEASYTYNGVKYGSDRYLGMAIRPVYDLSYAEVSPFDPVELGLSVKWSGVNVGASAPYELGGYYAWGETNTDDVYDWNSYELGKSDNLLKYNGDDNLTALKREDDVAYQKLGGGYWRMPTIEEWKELQDKCDWSVITYHGQRGYIIKSRVNNNAIFLPIYGFMEGKQLRDGMRARYWSSSLTDGPYLWKSRSLNESSYTYNGLKYGDDRCLGMPVRAVYDEAKDKKPLTQGAFVDMGLSVDWASANMGTSQQEEIGNYYSWGELAPKKEGEEYSWDFYKFGKSDALTKYNDPDNLKILDREDDVVYQKYKKNYRMPTKAEWDELWNNCTSELIRINGRLGYYLTSKKNGNTLFIPVSGYMDKSQLRDGMRPRYWSSSLTDGPYLWNARNVNEGSYTYNGVKYGNDRCLGMPVRAIKAKYEQDVTPSDIVDLGLKVKWASCNLGMSNPEDIGYYYAWGETSPDDTYTWESYNLAKDGLSSSLKKYNDEDGRRILDWNDDAVHKKYGGNWRMPTIDDWAELRNNCDWYETTRNGVRGFRIVSRTNGNSIFLPMAGYKEGTQQRDGMRPRYWASNITDGPYLWKSRNLNEGSYTYNGVKYGDDRCLGMLVRGVYDDNVEKALTSGTVVNLGLSVDWASCNIGAKNPEEFGNYYSWGDTKPRSTYTWTTYPYGSESDGTITLSKYNDKDKNTTLNREDDVAYQDSDGDVRMPTIGEWTELMENTTHEMMIKNGHLGYLLTSKKNGNSIFLPIAGYKDAAQNKDGMRPRYWASNLTDGPYLWKSRNLNESSYTYNGLKYGDDRRLGMTVRGVRDK